MAIKSNGTDKGDRLASLFETIDAGINQQRQEWIEALKAKGVKGAHADTGWSDRENKSVQLAYPYFWDNSATIGDRFVLGSYHDKWREGEIVKILKPRETFFNAYTQVFYKELAPDNNLS